MPGLMKRLLSALVVSAALVVAPAARAGEPSAADSETALQLYKEGKALREAGDAEGALAKLKAAYALAETPITAFELGRAYIAAGQLVEARGVLLTVSRMPVRNNESAKATDARASAEALASELRPRLASLTVHPKGASPVAPKISIDGVAIPSDAALVPRMLNPGSHVVVLEVNGSRSQAEVTLAEGQAKDLDVMVAPASAAPAGPMAAPGTPPPAPETNRSPLVYAGFGTAAVGLVVGTVTGILTLSKASTLDSACSGGRCPPSSQSDIDSASTLGAISTAAFIIAGVGVGVGVVGLYLTPSASKTALRVMPAGLAGTF